MASGLARSHSIKESASHRMKTNGREAHGGARLYLVMPRPPKAHPCDWEKPLGKALNPHLLWKRRLSDRKTPLRVGRAWNGLLFGNKQLQSDIQPREPGLTSESHKDPKNISRRSRRAPETWKWKRTPRRRDGPRGKETQRANGQPCPLFAMTDSLMVRWQPARKPIKTPVAGHAANGTSALRDSQAVGVGTRE
ncbi:hypothetical protein EYF80_010838 [Liparis tanakae]|uniref:Uncharacterized protein n=1 Tax=Liparis tanakae TaxID=230148 RepID=A0A4Z2INW3_9TELE|nr:hypothetical protein EYF80_010838 [Liparis tanakae]